MKFQQIFQESGNFAEILQNLRIFAKVCKLWQIFANAAESSPDLLILDEVGVQFGSDFEKQILFDVLNERYEKLKPSILLSNIPGDQLADYLGERVTDRLRENGGKMIGFDWDSYWRNP